jgi:hypothetical protein
MNVLYSVGYYILLGISKVRKYLKSFNPEPTEISILRNDGLIVKHTYEFPPSNYKDKLICIKKNGIKYLSCAQEYHNSIITFDDNISIKPNKFVEISITPQGIDIVEEFGKYIPHDNCINKVSWADILTFENITINDNTIIHIVDYQFNNIIIKNFNNLCLNNNFCFKND